MSETSWPTLIVHQLVARDQPTPVVLGVPIPRGQVRDAATLGVISEDGTPTHSAVRSLVSWPDGSVRWVLVSFLATRSGRHTVSPQRVATAGSPVIRVEQPAGQITLDTGRSKITLAGDGPGPIARYEANGKTILAQPRDFRLVVDDADSTHETVRKLTILEQNAVRVRVRVEGAHWAANGKRKLSYRLDVEAWAGVPTLRLDYHFFNLEPGQEYLDVNRIAVEADIAVDARLAQRHFLQIYHGEFYEPREVLNPQTVAIVADSQRRAAHVEDPAMLLDDTQYAAYLDAPLIETNEWLGVTEGQSHVYLHMQDFINMPPKRLAGQGNRLTLDVWPGRAGTLKLQQGRSRRQVMTIAPLLGDRPNAATISRAISVPFWEGRASVAPEWLSRCGEFEQDKVLTFGKHGRFERFLSRVVNLSTPADMFDLGDTPDSGYSTSYPSLGMNRVHRVAGAGDYPRAFDAGNSVLTAWSNPLSYERVWVNNEYDGIHTIACELMRSGQPQRWTLLRWMVRHNIEVDFLHYHDQKWLHRTSPVHSSRHTTSGAYPSHFWTQGLMEYYCLTGDPDVLEVAVALGEKIIIYFHDPVRGKFYKDFDRENGWALLALVHVYDISRQPQFEKEINRLVDFFMNHDPAGKSNTPSFDRAGTWSRSLITSFYFMLNMVEAIDLYAKITGRKDLVDYLHRLLSGMPKAIYRNYLEGYPSYSTAAALAIAFEHTGDIEYLKAGLVRLEDLVNDDSRWLNPVPEIKPMAIVHREMIRYLGHAQRQGLLDSFEYSNLRGKG